MMSETQKEECVLQELKDLLLEMLKDREMIREMNEKHFKSMVSLYEASKKLYEDTVKIQQESIQQYGINKVSKKQCSTKSIVRSLLQKFQKVLMMNL